MFDHNRRINPNQKVLTKTQFIQLTKNHEAHLTGKETAKPVVKLFGGAATWLLSEISPDGIAYCVADLGFGTPEAGYIDLNEICTVADQFRHNPLRWIQRDLWFKPIKTLTEYLNTARAKGTLAGC